MVDFVTDGRTSDLACDDRLLISGDMTEISSGSFEISSGFDKREERMLGSAAGFSDAGSASVFAVPLDISLPRISRTLPVGSAFAFWFKMLSSDIMLLSAAPLLGFCFEVG